MRWTKRVSVWPVGLSGRARWAGPVVENGTVARFHTNWAVGRYMPLDMAGFAINLKVLLKDKPKVLFNMKARIGYLEPDFLQSLGAVRNELEPLAENCTKVCVAKSNWSDLVRDVLEDLKVFAFYRRKFTKLRGKEY